MSAPKQTKKLSSRIRHWLLGLSIVIILSVISTFIYRERIMMSAANYLAKSHGVSVEQLTGLTMQFDLQQPLFIDHISLNNIAVSVDYVQFKQATAGPENKNETNSTGLVIPALPYWIPDLHIANITVKGEHLPAYLNRLDVKDISFRYSNVNPELAFSVWQQDQQLLTAQFNYVSKDRDVVTDRDVVVSHGAVDDTQILKAQLIADLSNINAIITRVLPDFKERLSGHAKLELRLDPKNRDSIALTAQFTDAGLHYEQLQLIDHTSATVETTLIRDDERWLPETIDLNLNHIDPIIVSAETCLPFTALLNAGTGVCQPFQQGDESKLDPVVITPLLPFSMQIAIPDRNMKHWQIKTEQLSAVVSMADNELVIQANKLRFTPEYAQGNWALSVATNSRYLSDSTVLAPMSLQAEAQGHITIDLTAEWLNTTVILKDAKITAQQFKYKDMSSEDIQIKLLVPTTIHIEDHVVLPFNSVFSTTLRHNQYQQGDKINALIAQHKMQFTDKLVTLDSAWQVDGATLASQNTVSLRNFAVNNVTGYWLLPKQAIPSVITDKYPLPKGLYLPAVLTNRLDYQLHLNLEHPYLTANMKGTLTADKSNFNDISAFDINARWGCDITASGPDVITSLDAKCLVNSDVSSVDMGLVVDNINVSGVVSFANEQLQVAVDHAAAEIFSGTFSFSPLLITDLDHIVGRLHVRNLSLSEVLELYQVPGVSVTGLLKADLPFVVHGSAISITNGSIEQQGAGGVIQIKDNVSIEQLKLTQPQLRYALELLENLHYDSLHSDIDYKPSGDTKLTINIKGRNPNVERPIEFNYSHEENILQLFRSLRINDAMYDALDRMSNP